MAPLPDDVAFDVLTRLPVKSLIRFKCVNKLWCSLVSNPHFIYSHLDRAKKEKEAFIISCRVGNSRSTIQFFSLEEGGMTTLNFSTTLAPLGTYNVMPSCNGLVCLYGGADDIHVCNPSTQKLVTLPKTHLEEGWFFLCCGFGFHHSTKEYKVIKLSERPASQQAGKLHLICAISTLGSGSWRRVEISPTYRPLNRDNPVYVNGYFYWIAAASSSEEVIVSFDVGNEKLEVIRHPECLSGKKHYLLSLVELGGELCLVDLDFEGENKRRMDIWKLVDRNPVSGDRGGWMRESIVHPSEPIDGTRPVGIRDGKIMLYGFINGLDSALNWYDVQSKSFSRGDVHGISWPYFFISSYVPSLVPLGGSCS